MAAGGGEESARSVVLVPFPAQGHLTPMLHLASVLRASGLAIVVALPDFFCRRLPGLEEVVTVFCLPTGLSDGGTASNFAAVIKVMEDRAPAHLEHGLKGGSGAAAAARVVVVDVLASWAVPVARRCGVPVVGFWPAMRTSYGMVAAIPELIDKGLISQSGIPLPNNQADQERGEELEPAGLPVPKQAELRTSDLPWLVGDTATQRSRFQFWLQTLRRTSSLRSILVNSFPGESCGGGINGDDDDNQEGLLQLLPVGPLLNHIGDNHTSIPSLWTEDSGCVGWLERQPSGSVVYVSFGSWIGPVTTEEIGELALGLESAGRPFLWVLKDEPSWRKGLPEGFAERVAGRGKLVGWAPQEHVLRSSAVGCFLSHCGWNSIVEAIQHEKPLLCHPIAGDQFVNCAHAVKVWKVGLRLERLEQGEVARCVQRATEGKEAAELRRRVSEMKKKVFDSDACMRAREILQAFVDVVHTL